MMIVSHGPRDEDLKHILQREASLPRYFSGYMDDDESFLTFARQLSLGLGWGK